LFLDHGTRNLNGFVYTIWFRLLLLYQAFCVAKLLLRIDLEKANIWFCRQFLVRNCFGNSLTIIYMTSSPFVISFDAISCTYPVSPDLI